MAGDRDGKRKPQPSAYQRALGLLVRREQSRKELSRKLKARGIEDEETLTTLDVLARQDFQNDARFAEALARTRAAAGYGPVRIRAELGSHGLGRDSIEAALVTCEIDWAESARRLSERRFGRQDLSDPAVRRKAVDFLLRRGFEQKTAYSLIRGRRTDGDADD